MAGVCLRNRQGVVTEQRPLAKRASRRRGGGKYPVVLHEVAQGDGFKNAVQGGLQIVPGAAYFAAVKTHAVAGLFQTTGKFKTPLHELDYAAEGQVFGLAQQHMPPARASNTARNARKAQLT